MSSRIEEINIEILELQNIIDNLNKLKTNFITNIMIKEADITEIYNKSITSDIIDNWKGTSGKDFSEKTEETKVKIRKLQADWNDLITVIDSDIELLSSEISNLEYERSLEESNG